jgi:two-component system response regulator NreC
MHSSATTIILADDHRIVRQGLHALLKAESDFDVIGEADDGLEALELVKNLNPDVAVLDLMMPGLNGLETARQINKQYPQTKTVILSMYDDEGFVLEALSNGVSAYVLKDAGSAELIRAVRDVRNGHRYLSDGQIRNAHAARTRSSAALRRRPPEQRNRQPARDQRRHR